MKTLKLIPIGILLLLSVATLSAQNTLPDPHNDNCWSSLAALRACQLQAYDEAQDYAQRCTSYPEYQCNNYYQPQQKAAVKQAKTIPQTANSNSSGAVSQESASEANAQAGSSR
ncbi:MAG: hypothetical protein WA655_02280 [Candidatus Korobacteraceae bacterium]